MGLTVPQTVHFTGATAPPSSVSLPIATTVGNLVVVVVSGFNGAPGTSSVTDSKGNTYVRDHVFQVGLVWQAVYSSRITTGGTSHSVTFTEGGVDIVNLDVAEIAGAVTSTPLDKTATNSATSTGPYTTGSTGTLAQADEIVLVGVGVDTGEFAEITEDGTYTLIGEFINGSGGYVSNVAYKILAATTAVNHSWTSTFGSNPWIAIAVTYKAAVDSATGTVAVTEADDAGVITGTFTAAPPDTFTGIIAVTEADDAAVITGVFTAVFTGVVAATAGNDVPVITGTFTPSFGGVVDVTEANDTAAIVGTFVPVITGTVAATEANDVAVITGTVVNPPPTFRYPVAVSGRKFVDQLGDVFLFKDVSSWGMIQNLSDADITEALEGVADRHFAGPIACLFGVRSTGAGWSPFVNWAGQAAFTGTPYQSSLGAAWASCDHYVSECTRLGLVAGLSLWISQDNDGPRTQIEAASNAQMQAFGAAVGARYAATPNIVWHLMGDNAWSPTSTLGQRVDAFWQGIRSAEGGTPRLLIAEPYFNGTDYEAYISQQLDHGTTGGYQYLKLSANSPYNSGATDSVDYFDACYNQSGATTYPVWDCEPKYNGSYGGGAAPSPTQRQDLRERNYAVMLRGGVGINYGDESWWPFDKPGLFSPPWTWQDSMTEAPAIDAQHCWDLVDAYCRDLTWAPDDTIVTTGTGTGDTKAAAGSSDTALLAYFPTSRTVVVDTVIRGDELAYLTPSTSTATTPDVAIPTDFCIVAKVRKPAFGTAMAIAGQAATPTTNAAWRFGFNSSGALVFDYSTTGTSLNGSLGTLASSAYASIATGDPLYVALSLDREAGSYTYGGWWSADGITWNGPSGGGTIGSPFSTLFDSTAPIKVGGYSTPDANVFSSGVEWVELRSGVTPTTGSAVWRFDALDSTGGTTWSDGLGHTWTVTSGGAVTREHGPSPVQLRWYDPQLGTYATIAASEAQTTGRSVSYPSNHGDGSSDYVLVVDLAGATVCTVAVTEQNDTAAIVGVVGPAPTGVIAVSDADDVAAIVGTVGVDGVIAAVGGPDVAAIVATVTPPGGTIATVEEDDAAVITGTFTPSFVGIIDVTQAPDVPAIVGTFTTLVSGVIAVTEAPDVAAIDGTFTSIGVDALLIITEANDTAVIVGAFIAAPVVGVIAAVETNDTARITAFLPGATIPSGGLIIGEWRMRRGDRLPLFALAIEDVVGNPVDITDATVRLVLHHEQNLPVIFPVPDPPIGELIDGALALPMYVYDGPGGVVIYDWPDQETEHLSVGVMDLQVLVEWPDGSRLTAPTGGDAFLVVRPSVLDD